MILVCIAVYVVVALGVALGMPRIPNVPSDVEIWIDLLLGAMWPIVIVAVLVSRLFNGGRK